ncbi:MAG: hypothetical protein E6Q95_04935 [Chitinophagaceae bacterium]|nr:MAG: hypothetical protein E6Q95_04935 [Chitinophagaceae bacterium]
MSHEKNFIIKGEIIFDNDIKPIIDATLYVMIENVTYLDEKAELIKLYTKKNIHYNINTDDNLQFILTLKNLNHHDSYNLRVHIDIDNNNTINIGDYITVQSYPLQTSIPIQKLSIQIKQIS